MKSSNKIEKKVKKDDSSKVESDVLSDDQKDQIEKVFDEIQKIVKGNELKRRV